MILAAGRGARMRSALPKPLHQVAGRSMLRLVCDAARDAGVSELVVVTPDMDGPVAQHLRADSARPAVRFAVQQEPLGTAHAALAARPAVGEAPKVMILNADLPLLTARTLRAMAERHDASGHVLTFLTAYLDDPTGYGRVLRRSGRVHGVVEDIEADAGARGEPEVNAGLYAAEAAWLWPALEALPPGSHGERYLTGAIAAAVQHGGVQTYQVTESSEVQQVSSRVELAAVEQVMRQRVRRRLMTDGVTLVDPATTYVDVGVRVGADTTLLPGVHLLGESSIGSGCRIGPAALLRDMRVGDGCEIGGSTLEHSTLADGVTIGPYCHVRMGSTIERDVYLGNYAEVKASRVGAGSKIGHFSYIGDSDLGAGVNIGAGAVTCNFDGQHKHRTRIGDGAFIGSDSMLIAPLEIGAQARTAAGSVVTRDVPPGAHVVGAPARERARGDKTDAAVDGGC